MMMKKKLNEKISGETVAPHLPKEVRQKGKGDLGETKWFLKLFVLSVVFGFASGIVGGMVVNSRFLDNWLWGEGGAWKPLPQQISRTESKSLTRDNLARKTLLGAVDFYVLPAKTAADAVIDPAQKIGGGAVLTSDGFLATTRAVLGRAARSDIAILGSDKKIYRIKKVILDDISDLALVKVEGGDLSALPFASADELYSGLELWVPHLSFGIQPARLLAANFFEPRAKSDYYLSSERVYRLGLLDVTLEKNYLGTPVVTGRGELAGILSGINTFLRADVLQTALRDVLSLGEPRRAYLGAHYLENAHLINGEKKSKSGWGVILAADPYKRLPALSQKSPLIAAGLKAGDTLVSVAGEAITPLRSLPEILIDYAPGSQVEVKYERAGEEKAVTIVLSPIP